MKFDLKEKLVEITIDPNDWIINENGEEVIDGIKVSYN